MDELLSRITFDQQVLRGKPVIRGMRISVEMIQINWVHSKLIKA